MLNSVKIGFVGLGRMGGPIARNIAKAGYHTMVLDSNKEKCSLCTEWTIAKSVEELSAQNHVIFMSLPGSPQVEETVNNLLLSGSAAGKIIIDLSTSYPFSSRMLYAKVKSAGGHFLDAPLSGGPANAAAGTVNTMIGGDKDVLDQCMPLFQTFAKNIFYVGQSGAGNVIKLASNYLSIIYISLYSEIIPFVEKMGVDPNELFRIVSVSGANSPVFQLVAPKIINQKYDISFGMSLAIKDLDYSRRLFEEIKSSGVMLNAAVSIFNEAIAQGISEEDVSAVAKVIRNKNA